MRSIAVVLVVVLAAAPAAAVGITLKLHAPRTPTVYFQRGSEVVDPSDVPRVDEMAAKLLRRPEIKKLAVIGHASTDDARTALDRWNLSLARARAVVDRIVGQGVARERLVMRAYGSDRPADDRNRDFSRAKNRRIELVIVEGDGR